jgi:hypothetical protein
MWGAALADLAMNYHTVFDVSRNGVQLLIPFLIFIGAGLFSIIGWALRKSGEHSQWVSGILFQVLGAIGLLGALGFLIGSYGEYRRATRSLSNHDYFTVEGVVSYFVPMPPGGHANESFRINGVSFSYGSGWGSTAFNSDWNKGLIHNGTQARITYRGQDILRVEVR